MTFQSNKVRIKMKSVLNKASVILQSCKKLTHYFPAEAYANQG